jgi:hypothetical protein
MYVVNSFNVCGKSVSVFSTSTVYTVNPRFAFIRGGRFILSFVTHQGSGLSGLDATLKTLFPKSLVKNGIAVRGEDCQNNRDNVKEQVLKWLKSIE